MTRDPVTPDIIRLSDLVQTTAARDSGELFYCVGGDDRYVLLANGKNRTLDQPKRKLRRHVQKVLRSETRVALKLQQGDKVLNGELRRDLAYLGKELQSTNLGG